LVANALRAVRKGGRVVCGAILMSYIRQLPYSIEWEERHLLSVANVTRQDAFEFHAIAPEIGIKTMTIVYLLEQANATLADLRAGRFQGAGLSSVLLGERVTTPQSIVDLAAVSCRQFVGSDCSRERIVASKVGLRSRFKCASSVVLAKAFSRCSMAPRCCFMALSRKQIFIRSFLQFSDFGIGHCCFSFLSFGHGLLP
jgi:hypothetical protein